MSRFKDRNINHSYSYLDDEQINNLYCILDKYLSDNKKTIEQIIANDECEYKVITPNESIVVVIKKAKNPSSYFQIGYPFPIYSRKINKLSDKHEILIHIRGEILRKRLNENCIKKIMSYYSSSQYNLIDNTNTFLQIVKENMRSTNNNIAYIDTNSFIGDGIMELKWVDYLKEQYDKEKCFVISRNAKHIKMYYEAIDFDNFSSIKSMLNGVGTIFIADLLDAHVEIVEKFFREFHPKIPVCLIGKHTIVIPNKDGGVQIYRLNKDDSLLRAQGFQKYVDECIEPFIDFDKISVKDNKTICTSSIKVNSGVNIFVNVFSSQNAKDIDIGFIESLIKNAKEKNNVRLLFSRGLKNIEYHKEIIEKIKLIAKLNNFEGNIEIIEDNSLSELNEILKDKNVVAGISADTSISHMLTRNGMLNFTCYYYGFWDSTSEQSISCESMLSVCSKDINQIPVLLLDKDKYSCITNSIIYFIVMYSNYIQGIEKFCNYNMNAEKFNNTFQENIRIYNEMREEISEEIVNKAESLFNYRYLEKEYEQIKNNIDLSKRVFEISPLVKIINIKGEI